MPAAGAADRDCKIGLAADLVTRQQRAQQAPQPVEEWREIDVSLDVRGNRRVVSGQRPEIVNIIRIVEKAHIEDQIGIARHAVTISKRGDENVHAARIESEMSVQHALQIAGGQGRGVDHQIGAVAQGRNHWRSRRMPSMTGRSPASG